jgi:hypothetical protein
MTATTATLPNITCPSWCGISEGEHQADLSNQEGRCIHHSHRQTPDGWSIVSTTTPDGQPWPEEGEDRVMIYDGSDVITLDDAETRANALLELVKAARA